MDDMALSIPARQQLDIFMMYGEKPGRLVPRTMPPGNISLRYVS